MLAFSLLAGLIVQSAPAARPPDPPARAPVAPMTFALADSTGKRLLGLGDPASIAEPRAFDAAICDDGSVAQIAYLKLQRGTPGGTGRQTAANFDHLTGHLYRVASPEPVPANATCLLTAAAFAREARAVPLAVRGTWESGSFVGEGRCPQDLVAPLERAFKARASACLPLGPADRDRGAVMAFIEGAEVPTAVLVYAGPAGVFTREVRAAAGHDETSCWRVDDGCEIHPRSYRLVAVHAGGTTRLVVLGDGPEGQNAELAELRDGKIVAVLGAYRYWSPE